MRKIFLFFILMILGIASAAAVSGDSDRVRTVQFSPTPFARAGFSDNPVPNSVEPENGAPSISLAFDDEAGEVSSEETVYAYCQAFTRNPVRVTVSGTPLGNSSVGTYSWTASFTGLDGLIAGTSASLSSSSSVTILDEAALAGIDRGASRHYCWSVKVTLDEVNGEPPRQPGGNREIITGTMTIEVVSD